MPQKLERERSKPLEIDVASLVLKWQHLLAKSG
jgi:hypothetical protein